MQLREFEFVIEINKYGSVSKAAKALKIAQPTLSKYLARLEEKLGVVLFERGKLPLKPTEAGEKYITAGKRILETYMRLEKDFSEMKSGEDKSLKIGISPTRAHFVLPKLVSEFHSRNKDTKLVVREKNTSGLNYDLANGSLDLIISLKYDGTKTFECVPLFDESVLFAIPKKYQGKPLSEILSECEFIQTEKGLNISNMMGEILFESGREDACIEVQSIESALALTNEGLGISLVPSYVRDYGIYENVFFEEIPEEIKGASQLNLKRQICIFYRKGESLSRAAEDIIKICKDIL